VSPGPIIKAFDELEEDKSGLRSRLKGRALDTLAFERAKERLHHRVIVAVATAAHTDDHSPFSKYPLIAAAVILASEVDPLS
jgi:hypothetical protein